MEKNIIKKFVFADPCNILIGGASQSGKSTWVRNVIEHVDEMFINPPCKIIYCYKVYQTSFGDLAPKVCFVKGIPNDIEKISNENNGRHILMILDDLMVDVNESIVNLFTVQTHHLNISSMFIVQNLFHNNKNMRTISLNAHYIITFRQTRDSNQMAVLARQIFSKQAKEVMEIYTEAMKIPYNYMLINIHPSNIHRASVHENIFPEENEIVWLE